MEPDILILLVIGSVAVTALSRRWSLPAPLVLVALALGLSFALHERVEIPPEAILGFVLPPLLYSASLECSYQDFRVQLRAITRLGVGLILVTAFVVAVVAALVVPWMPFAEAMLLGAIVAPPDAVSAAAVARKLHLPRRVMTILSGESLINDAASLTLFKVALAGIGTTGIFLHEGLTAFGLAVGVGVPLGLVMGFIVHIVRVRLKDPTVEVVIGFIVPFAAYWLAELWHGSGVLAVVAAGLYLGYRSPQAGYATRLQERPVWAAVDLVLESVVFAYIGLQLKFVIMDVINARDQTGRAFILSGAVFITILIVRPIYIFATNWIDNIKFPWTKTRTMMRAPSFKESIVVSWAGMRGVVTLAAAAAIPVTIHGVPVPERATLQLAAITAAIGTLLLQGTTLPWVIRKLNLSGDDEARDRAEEAQVRRLAAAASSRVLAAKIDEWAEHMGRARATAIAQRVATAVERQGQAVAEILERSNDNLTDDNGNGNAEPVTAAADLSAAAEATAAADLSANTAPADISPPASAPTADIPGVGPLTVAEPPPIGIAPALTMDPGLLPEDALAPPWPNKRGPIQPTKRKTRWTPERAEMVSDLRRELISTQRSVLVDERDAGRLSETVMRQMLRELDLEEEILSSSWVARIQNGM